MDLSAINLWRKSPLEPLIDDEVFNALGWRIIEDFSELLGFEVLAVEGCPAGSETVWILYGTLGADKSVYAVSIQANVDDDPELPSGWFAQIARIP